MLVLRWGTFVLQCSWCPPFLFILKYMHIREPALILVQCQKEKGTKRR